MGPYVVAYGPTVKVACDNYIQICNHNAAVAIHNSNATNSAPVNFYVEESALQCSESIVGYILRSLSWLK